MVKGFSVSTPAAPPMAPADASIRVAIVENRLNDKPFTGGND
jgi:hypothetical protein